MSSIIEGYSYDIFISYRQKDNKHDNWVTEFVNNLKGELESTFKEEISVYFDLNPHDGLMETHDVDASLKDKLKCLVFIPIISRTYCDPKSFAWEHEFNAFVDQASQDKFGLKIKLPNGNVANRVLPVRIHDLDNDDVKLCESVLGGVHRGIEFIYKEPGVDRPLAPDDNEKKNLNSTKYRNQVNKVALAIKEIITVLKKQGQYPEVISKQDFEAKPAHPKNLITKIIIISAIIPVLIVLGCFFIPKLFNSSKPVEKSIDVLPFKDMSPQKDQEYFSDGMVDAILDHLFKVGNLKVISRTSSLRYKNTKLTLKEIAQELGVSALLEGSVQKIGNKVRITAQLIDPRTSFHLWSETYDRDLTDIFSIQSEVAQNVARELKATLTSKETQLIQNAPLTTNQLAYDFYLKGNDYFSKYNFLLASDMYSKAIEKDSLFAVAYAKRARTQLHIYWTKGEGWQGHHLKALEDIKKVLHLNPELPELKLTLAVAKYYIDRNYDKALKILNELKTETPNLSDLYAYSSFILRRQGKWDESIRELKLGIQLDPFNALYIENLIETYEFSHQYDNQIECSRQGLSLLPDYKNFNVYIFSGVLNKTGDLKTSLKESGLNEEDVQYRVYYYTKQYDKLIAFKNKDTAHPIDQYYYSPKTVNYALIYYLNSNKSFCKIYADSSIMFLKEKLNETPDDDRMYASLGKSYAFSGNAKEAIVCGKKAVNLKPIKLDAMEGSIKEQNLMEIYLFTGNYDLAMDKMEYLLSIPSQLSIGKLMIDPIFDNLRSLLRFQKIINSIQK